MTELQARRYLAKELDLYKGHYFKEWTNEYDFDWVNSSGNWLPSLKELYLLKARRDVILDEEKFIARLKSAGWTNGEAKAEWTRIQKGDYDE